MKIETNEKRKVNRSRAQETGRQCKWVEIQSRWSIEELISGEPKQMKPCPQGLRGQSFTPFVLRHGS
jgi:hypothetical protein